jgi:hypothetical protein
MLKRITLITGLFFVGLLLGFTATQIQHKPAPPWLFWAFAITAIAFTISFVLSVIKHLKNK